MHCPTHLVGSVPLDSKLAAKALGCIRLGGVLSNISNVLVSYCALRGETV